MTRSTILIELRGPIAMAALTTAIAMKRCFVALLLCGSEETACLGGGIHNRSRWKTGEAHGRSTISAPTVSAIVAPEERSTYSQPTPVNGHTCL